MRRDMTPTTLLLIGAGSIAILLVLIMWLKLNATVSLIVVSAGTALVAGTSMTGLLDQIGRAHV